MHLDRGFGCWYPKVILQYLTRYHKIKKKFWYLTVKSLEQKLSLDVTDKSPCPSRFRDGPYIADGEMRCLPSFKMGLFGPAWTTVQVQPAVASCRPKYRPLYKTGQRIVPYTIWAVLEVDTSWTVSSSRITANMGRPFLGPNINWAFWLAAL